ncbi:MAG: serine hydrolase [Eubacterium sp.]|nr:serine hydrolase [Eubacterium sp.]
MGYKFERASCTESGINPKAVYDFINKAEKENLGIDSFMLLKGGKVVAEGCHAPYTMDSPHVLYSFSKSVTAIALMYAVDEGKISLNDSITKFFPQYDKHRRNEKITVRHLVTMTAGKMVGMAKNRHHKDWIKIFFDAPAIAKPGKQYMYVNDNFYMLSAIIGKVYGETLVDFLYPRLFEHLEIEKPVWEVDDFGYAAGGWGLYMSITDTAKLIQCCANGGKWQGKQILPEEQLKEFTKYQVPTLNKGQIDVTKGYGYGFWRTSIPDTYRAYGLHGQMGYVFEKKDTVLVIHAGISKDELLALAVDKLAETLWDEPVAEYEDKLKDLLSSLGDKDNLPIEPRSTKLEQKFNQKELKTRSTMFASMLHATMSTVMNELSGNTDRFILSLEKNGDLSLMWKEGFDVNTIVLGMENKYVYNKITLAGLKFTACTKAAWTTPRVLTVYVRLLEGCHVRKLVFVFDNEGKVIIRNDSYPDMPTLAVHYMDFSGFPLPDKLESLLLNHVAPAVLLIGEPNFRIQKMVNDFLME